ncbi:PspA/IM30 family protein [Paenibacillus sp. GCM10027627]|uniref:PspA/IM30 family protein n=1 Tax=unclassified Paenibacillus TaxID=185978 RepID=UPI003633E8A7
MGILQRVVNMTKAAANEMLDKMENPVMMLNHYLRDLDEEIAKTERGLASQKVQERMLTTKYDELVGQANYYEGKAEQAAVEGREAEARTAIEAKLLYEEQAEETAKLSGIAKQAALDLELRVEALKEEKTRLQAKREELVTRVRRTSAQANSPEAHSLHGVSSASREFERIEHKVMEWEAQRELFRSRHDSYGSRVPSSHEQKQEQRSALVEEQLNRLLQKQTGN